MVDCAVVAGVVVVVSLVGMKMVVVSVLNLSSSKGVDVGLVHSVEDVSVKVSPFVVLLLA